MPPVMPMSQLEVSVMVLPPASCPMPQACALAIQVTPDAPIVPVQDT